MPSTKAAPRPARYRVRVARKGPACALTHLAQIEALRRAVSASGLPAATDRKRKRARPKLAFGPAISLGYASRSEYFDMELTETVAPEQVGRRLSAALPGGFSLEAVRRIPPFYPSLDASLNVACYEIEGPFMPDAAKSLKNFLQRKSIVIRKIKQGGARIEEVEARPLIREMALIAPHHLSLTLRFGPKRTVKPEALLKAWLGNVPMDEFRILRRDLLSETAQGQLLTP